MLGVNLLVRLGRQVLKGPIAEAGLLPVSYYRHLVLEAMESEDFPGALEYLKWTDDPLLAQILILRLRLLAARHGRQRQAILELVEKNTNAGAGTDPGSVSMEKYQDLLTEEDQALKLLGGYEARALTLLTAAAKPGVQSNAVPFGPVI